MYFEIRINFLLLTELCCMSPDGPRIAQASIAGMFGVIAYCAFLHPAAFSMSSPIPEMLLISSLRSPCRCLRYSGALYDSQTFPCASSEARAFNGRSSAMLGEAIIKGVPDLGLPKISNCVAGMRSPALAASTLKSMCANTVSPRDFTSASSR
jgi:hypothetical protein